MFLFSGIKKIIPSFQAKMYLFAFSGQSGKFQAYAYGDLQIYDRKHDFKWQEQPMLIYWPANFMAFSTIAAASVRPISKRAVRMLRVASFIFLEVYHLASTAIQGLFLVDQATISSSLKPRRRASCFQSFSAEGLISLQRSDDHFGTFVIVYDRK